jgi:hypothetical protein
MSRQPIKMNVTNYTGTIADYCSECKDKFFDPDLCAVVASILPEAALARALARRVSGARR